MSRRTAQVPDFEEDIVERIGVHVHARDPISRAGVVSQLRPRPEVRVLDARDADAATVLLVVVDGVEEQTVQLIRATSRAGSARVVLVAGRIDDQDLVSVVEAGVVGVVRRADATPERLVQVIRAAAAGEGTVPPDLLGRLLHEVGRVQRQVLGPRGLSFSGLAAREIEVLRLVADGYDTVEIAHALSYSERTVKNVLHDVTNRLALRNRSHAVAYALRQGFL
jgi:DNA-binding NarL/FixJ family response regulator